MTISSTEDILLHACCGPCSLEPIRLLRERGIEPHIYYANSNIAPREEYEHRLETIRAFAQEADVAFTEGAYEPERWEATAGKVGEALRERAEVDTRARCRMCYRLRFEEAAAYAAEYGFARLGTTLSVSPYQYRDIIKEELERACDAAGIECAFEDYSPHYREATKRSRAMGMYRQNFCGCRFSDEEAQAERENRVQEQEKRARERAAREAEQQRARAERKAERAAYDEKQARKRAVLKELRMAAKADEGTELAKHAHENDVDELTGA